jgi:hypothetical protein
MHPLPRNWTERGWWWRARDEARPHPARDRGADGLGPRHKAAARAEWFGGGRDLNIGAVHGGVDAIHRHSGLAAGLATSDQLSDLGFFGHNVPRPTYSGPAASAPLP